MTEINWAEHEEQCNSDRVTEGQLRAMARAHVAYGWAHHISGDWTADQVTVYKKAYAEALASPKRPGSLG